MLRENRAPCLETSRDSHSASADTSPHALHNHRALFWRIILETTRAGVIREQRTPLTVLHHCVPASIGDVLHSELPSPVEYGASAVSCALWVPMLKLFLALLENWVTCYRTAEKQPGKSILWLRLALAQALEVLANGTRVIFSIMHFLRGSAGQAVLPFALESNQDSTHIQRRDEL